MKMIKINSSNKIINKLHSGDYKNYFIIRGIDKILRGNHKFLVKLLWGIQESQRDKNQSTEKDIKNTEGKDRVKLLMIKGILYSRKHFKCWKKSIDQNLKE